MKTLSIIAKFPKTFWIANLMELFERWAYYGMFVVLSIYLTNPVSEGGLGFSDSQRGIMQAVVTAILYLLPIIGGALADKFGFKKVLLAAFVTLASGYYAMGLFDTYFLVFTSFLIVAVGGALFKPIIVATVSKTTTKETDTIGFGIFYMIVNIGGFLGPFAASRLRDLSWNYVFIMCAVVILFNIVLLLFYKEPPKKEEESKGFSETISQILKNMGIALSDWKFLTFLIILVGFWTMYMQLFFTLPVYITQWIDTSDLYNASPLIANIIGTVENGVGIVRPEQVVNIAAFIIIFFQIIVSTLILKIKPIISMTFGAVIIAIGMSQFGLNDLGVMVALGVVILAFGEMASSPRIQEYIGRIAPKDKIALYMGVSYLPLAAGNLIGGLLSGSLYGSMSNKYVFLAQELADKGVGTLETLKAKDTALLFKEGMTYFNMTDLELTQMLFQNHNPGAIWLVFSGIGLGTAVLLFIYNQFILKPKD